MLAGAVPLPSIQDSNAHVEQPTQVVMFLTCIPEMTESNLGWHTG
jgi:hypothetical protein